MGYTIHQVALQDEFKICPICNYQDGFHSMFKQDEGVMQWLFICPSCHEVFDIGYTVNNFEHS